MKEKIMAEFVKLAKKAKGPISAIAAKSTEQGVVLVSKLEADFPNHGYKVECEDKNNGSWTRVKLNDEVKAQGYSSAGREDALLHAVWGAVREEHAAAVVEEEVVKRDLKLSPEVRQKMESAYILYGEEKFQKEMASL